MFFLINLVKFVLWSIVEIFIDPMVHLSIHVDIHVLVLWPYSAGGAMLQYIFVLISIPQCRSGSSSPSSAHINLNCLIIMALIVYFICF